MANFKKDCPGIPVGGAKQGIKSMMNPENIVRGGGSTGIKSYGAKEIGSTAAGLGKGSGVGIVGFGTKGTTGKGGLTKSGSNKSYD